MPRADQTMTKLLDGARRRRMRSRSLPDPEPFPVWSGRELYDYSSLTMLNRLAVDEHRAYITRGMVVTPDEDEPRQVVQQVVDRLLIDGALVWYAGGQVALPEFSGASDEEHPLLPSVGTVRDCPPEAHWTPAAELPDGGSFLDRVMFCTRDRAVQLVTDAWRRVVQWTGSGWAIQEWQQSETDEHKWLLVEQQDVATDAMRLYPGTQGLLVPAQTTFWRLEELQQALRRQTTKGALARIYIGYFGADDDEFEERIASLNDFATLPAGSQVINTADATVTSLLIDQYNTLFMRFFQGVHLVPSEALKDESGVARGWRFRPTVAFVEQVEDMADRILQDFGIVVDYQPMPVADASELAAHFAFFTGLYDAGIIDESEYVSQSRQLAGLGVMDGFVRDSSAVIDERGDAAVGGAVGDDRAGAGRSGVVAGRDSDPIG